MASVNGADGTPTALQMALVTAQKREASGSSRIDPEIIMASTESTEGTTTDLQKAPEAAQTDEAYGSSKTDQEIEMASVGGREGTPTALQLAVVVFAQTEEARGSSSFTRHETTMPSIFRAPAHIRYSRQSDFEPKLVSIGPYYHGRESLQPMEDLKHKCMSDLLKMRPVGGSNNDDVPVEAFMKFETDARSYYKEKINYGEADFVEMLVLDSCFIIRIVLSVSQSVTKIVRESMAYLDVNIKEVRSDLLLMENQIPLFFIEKVYDWLFKLDNKILPPLQFVLEPFMCLDMPWKFNSEKGLEAFHLLDYYWRCSTSSEVDIELLKLLNESIDSEIRQPSLAEIHQLANTANVIPNATALHQVAGIKFERLITNTKIAVDRDVSFSSNYGIMKMPCLKIDYSKTILLVNLIAFESYKLLNMRPFSNHVKLLDALIDSEKDVELLQQCGVIYNTLSSHKMAATFFNDIGNFCLVDNREHQFSNLYHDVREYYNSSWNKRWANLQRNYFNSPWAGISVLAAVTLLVLTVFQTVYTIIGYYYRRH